MRELGYPTPKMIPSPPTRGQMGQAILTLSICFDFYLELKSKHRKVEIYRVREVADTSPTASRYLLVRYHLLVF